MKCPNCGYNRQKRDDAFVPATECPSCGIVYSKHEGTAVPGLPISTGTPLPSGRPSAVDPESLKKAKERVEKRLRDRLETPVRDKRHAQTLELARKFTEGAVSKRRVQKPVNLNKKAEEASVNTPSTESDPAEAEKQDPLLLEDAVGVSIHNGSNDIAPETPVEETPHPDTVEDDNGINASPKKASEPEVAASEPEVTASAPEVTASAPDDLPETQEGPTADSENTELKAASYPEDVQVETVVLAPKMKPNDIEPSENITISSVATSEIESTAPETTELPPAYIAAASSALGVTKVGNSLKRLLPIIAWLILFSGVIGAVLSWTTISDVEAGINIPATSGSGSLPIGLLLGFAYLATGALGFAFFWVASLISQQLKDIRHLLMAHPLTTLNEETATDLPDEK